MNPGFLEIPQGVHHRPHRLQGRMACGWLLTWAPKSTASLWSLPRSPASTQLELDRQTAMDHRRHPRLRRTRKHHARLAAGIRLPPGRAAARALLLWNPVETYAVNVMGTVHVLEAVRRTPTSAPPSSSPATSVTKTASGSGPTARRSHRRPRSLQLQQGLRRNGHRRLSALIFPRSTQSAGSRRLAPAPATSSAAAIGRPTVSCRIPCAPIPRARRSSSATRCHAPVAACARALAGYLRLAELLRRWRRALRGWNFGPPESNAHPVHHLISEIPRHRGQCASSQIVEPKNLHEAYLLRLDSSKAAPRWGGRPRWNLDGDPRRNRRSGTEYSRQKNPEDGRAMRIPLRSESFTLKAHPAAITHQE